MPIKIDVMSPDRSVPIAVSSKCQMPLQIGTDATSTRTSNRIVL